MRQPDDRDDYPMPEPKISDDIKRYQSVSQWAVDDSPLPSDMQIEFAKHFPDMLRTILAQQELLMECREVLKTIGYDRHDTWCDPD